MPLEAPMTRATCFELSMVLVGGIGWFESRSKGLGLVAERVGARMQRRHLREADDY